MILMCHNKRQNKSVKEITEGHSYRKEGVEKQR